MRGFSAVLQMVRLCINQLSAEQSSLDVNNSIASQEIFPCFMECKVSLLCSQQPAIGTCPEPDKFSLHPPIKMHLMHGVSEYSFLFRHFDENRV